MSLEASKSELCVAALDGTNLPSDFVSRCVFEIAAGTGYEAAGEPVKYGAGIRLVTPHRPVTPHAGLAYLMNAAANNSLDSFSHPEIFGWNESACREYLE